MYYQLLNKLDKRFNFARVSALCAIPLKNDAPINGKQMSHLKVNHVPLTAEVNSYVLSAK
ncbi:hypothetical protein Q4503_10675 [Colwellia sp. 6_MG-2023]|uniref:hypothetical protein n=1 Tax=Colwellia sp. 6_MG-2023 TaxID=3062676 RepID=UPI0026E18015|nr:hypothetical protein [Colwellia sp. 6_MG-2023]MDO6488166.1 hypothetical protein [Colwellia sp. 6_MG-2023]